MSIRNRVTELLGVELPIVQAPMGSIAPRLAARYPQDGSPSTAARPG